MPWYGWLLWLCSSAVLAWFILLVSRPGWAVGALMSLLTGVRRVTSRSSQLRTGTRTSGPADPLSGLPLGALMLPSGLPSSHVRLVPEYELIARSAPHNDGLDDGTPPSWLAVSPEDVPPY